MPSPQLPLDVSAAFATTLSTPRHVQAAERLGYRRAWLYDTPQQSPDVWMCLALAAQRTSSIGLGPGVLVPSLRHPMVNAAATAALEQLAPGRVVVGFGTGYTGRRAMGQHKPVPWSYMARYVAAFQGLLRGETVEWDGGALRMLHTAESAPPTPIDMPLYLGAIGPRGIALAKDLADGLFVVLGVPEGATDFKNVAYLAFGTVLGEDEKETDARVRRAAGPGLMQALHAAYEFSGEDAVVAMPGGPEWLAVVRATPEHERHLAIHTGHLLNLNEADTAAWNAGAHTLLRQNTLTGSAGEVRTKVADLAAQGVTELVYQPSGDDIVGELESFAQALGLTAPG
ncbi:MAG TPA: LLM class flavin-dependent oxidoreductase [Mycobacterium sp.]